jgi:hypothetical protein
MQGAWLAALMLECPAGPEKHYHLALGRVDHQAALSAVGTEEFNEGLQPLIEYSGVELHASPTWLAESITWLHHMALRLLAGKPCHFSQSLRLAASLVLCHKRAAAGTCTDAAFWRRRRLHRPGMPGASMPAAATATATANATRRYRALAGWLGWAAGY